MRTLPDAIDHDRAISEGNEASYPKLLVMLETLNAEIAAARVLEVESAMRDIWQTMNHLGITLGQLSRYRTSRLPPRANETWYRNPQTGATSNGRGKPPEWLRGKVWRRFQIEPSVDTSANITHETERSET